MQQFHCECFKSTENIDTCLVIRINSRILMKDAWNINLVISLFEKRILRSQLEPRPSTEKIFGTRKEMDFLSFFGKPIITYHLENHKFDWRMSLTSMVRQSTVQGNGFLVIRKLNDHFSKRLTDVLRNNVTNITDINKYNILLGRHLSYVC